MSGILPRFFAAGKPLSQGYLFKMRIAVKQTKFYALSTKCDIPPWRIIKLLHAFVSKTEFLSRYEWVLFSGTIAPLAVKNHQEGLNI